MARSFTIRRRRSLILLFCSIVAFSYWAGILQRHVLLGLLNRPNVTYLSHVSSHSRTTQQKLLDELARNATLGFGAIYALSKGTPWRVSGLIAAANATGLEIQIPTQKPVSQSELDSLLDKASIKRGSGLAYFAHVNALKAILEDGPSTVLIMEDDADWDMEVKKQASRVARALRYLTKTDDTDAREKETPFGLDWDILWIGHCREVWKLGTPMLFYDDDTVIEHGKYIGDAAGDNFVNYVPDGKRAVSTSHRPTCTFGYGVTKAAIPEILWLLNDMLERGILGSRNLGLDVLLLTACNNHLLRCYTVTPELMTQYLLPAEAGSSSVIAAENNHDLTEARQYKDFGMGSSPNIVNSARCKALFGLTCVADHVAREY